MEFVSQSGNNQLLILIGIFLFLAALFAGIIVYFFAGFGRGGGGKSQKKVKWETFKGNLFGDSEEKPQPKAEEGQSLVANSSDQPQPGQNETPPRRGGLLKGAIPPASPPPPAPPADRSASPDPAPSLDDLAGRLNFEVTPSVSDSAPVDQPAPVASPPPPPSHLEVMRVLVDRESREIVLEVDGQRYEHIGQVTERAIGRRILEAVALLLQFSRGKIATVKGLKSLPVPEARLSTLPPEPQFGAATPAPSNNRPLTPIAAATTSPAPDPTPALSADERRQQVSDAEAGQVEQSFIQGAGLPPDFGHQREEPKLKRRSFFSRRSSDEPEQALPAFDLAAEINRILQEKLAIARERTPVEISSSIDGGLRIQVGSSFFTEVDSVDPPEIRELIQASIHEWEQKAFSGGSFSSRP